MGTNGSPLTLTALSEFSEVDVLDISDIKTVNSEAAQISDRRIKAETERNGVQQRLVLGVHLEKTEDLHQL